MRNNIKYYYITQDVSDDTREEDGFFNAGENSVIGNQLPLCAASESNQSVRQSRRANYNMPPCPTVA